jgi:hypothetical protein
MTGSSLNCYACGLSRRTTNSYARWSCSLSRRRTRTRDGRGFREDPATQDERRFEAEGIESLFGSERARDRRLPPALRRLVVDLKAEHPGFNLNEIANAVYVRFGRCPDHKTIRRVLTEEPIPLRFVRRFPPYHEIPERRERRAAVVALHADGWSAKAIAGYLRVGRSTVYRVLKRWAQEEGPEGAWRTDPKGGRPASVR